MKVFNMFIPAVCFMMLFVFAPAVRSICAPPGGTPLYGLHTVGMCDPKGYGFQPFLL